MQKLSRTLSPINVLALAFGSIIGWGAFVLPGNSFLIKAGPVGTTIGFAIATVVMILIAINYAFMISMHPVSGGEFTYADVAFGEKHAFVCAWFLGLSYLTIVPLNATALALIGRNLLDNVFQFGFSYTVAGYTVYLGELLIAIFALLILGWLSIRGARLSGNFQALLAMLLLLGVTVLICAGLAHGGRALEPGFPSEEMKGLSIFAIIAIAPWAFVGFDTVPQSIEESRFSPAIAKAILILAILFGGFVYISLNLLTAAFIPERFADWRAYIGALDNVTGLEALPTFHAAYVVLGEWGLLIIGLAVCAAILTGIIGFYMASSRLLFAMARRGVLPGWFAHVQPRFGTPVNALLFVMCISLIAPFFGRTVLGWLVDMSATGAAIGYGYTSLAAFRFAREKHIRLITCTGLLGSFFSLFFLVILLIPLPFLDCSLGMEAYFCLAVWIFLGVAFYKRRIVKDSSTSGMAQKRPPQSWGCPSQPRPEHPTGTAGGGAAQRLGEERPAGGER